MTDRFSQYIMAGAVVFALLLGLFGEGCHDGCDPEDTRCRGAVVQECASDGDWYTVENCATTGPDAWQCCETALIWESAETAGCVPVGDCDGGLQ
jgi:hypothetical protein